MKRSEKRERENLARIFYTMIQTIPSFTNSLSIRISKTLVINIIQVASIETLLPVYKVSVIMGWNIIGEVSMSVSLLGSRYEIEIREFKMAGGLKRIREVMEIIRTH
jgi:hypothetical protein